MPEDAPFHFDGFADPTFTPTPDIVFDYLAPQLSEAELRVLLYIVRRTFGFRKRMDSISINQLISGITTRDGRVLDLGTGMSRQGVMRGVKGLTDKGIITVRKERADDGVNQVNLYSLRFKQGGVVYDVDYGGPPGRQGVVHQVDPQETVEQETETTRSFEASKGPQFIFDEDRNAISTVMRDFARELGDTAPLPSTVSRAVNLYRHSGWALDPFLDALYEARRITQERTGSIKTASPRKLGPKPKVPYFFSVLESLITGNQRQEG